MAGAQGLLENSKYDLVPDSNSGRRVVLVKLTGSCLEALENDSAKVGGCLRYVTVLRLVTDALFII